WPMCCMDSDDICMSLPAGASACGDHGEDCAAAAIVSMQMSSSRTGTRAARALRQRESDWGPSSATAIQTIVEDKWQPSGRRLCEKRIPGKKNVASPIAL